MSTNYEEVQRMMREAQTPEEKRQAIASLRETIPPGQQGRVLPGQCLRLL